MTYPVTSFKDLNVRYSRLYKWLYGLDINITSSRFSSYRTILERLVRVYEEGDSDAMRNELDEFVTALYEIYDLVQIYESIVDYYGDDLKSHMRKISCGPAKYTDEKTNTSTNLNKSS